MKAGKRAGGIPTHTAMKEGTGDSALLASAMQFYQAGRFAEASRACQQLLVGDPSNLGGLHLAGLLALQAGRNEAAVGLLGAAIRLDENIPDLHCHLAEGLQRLERLDEAAARYQRAVALDPDYLEALYNGGNLLLRLKRPAEALSNYDRALAVEPNFADALHNRGNALLGLGRLAEALADYDRALVIKPDLVYALRNRGAVLRQLGRHEEALASYDHALAMQPDFAGALNDRGNALSDLGRYEDAAKDFAALLAIAPDYDYAQGALLSCRLYCCNWQDYDRTTQGIIDGIAAGKRVAVPYLPLFVGDAPLAQLQCSRIYGQDKFPKAEAPLWRGEIYRHDRIRIAYLSADFYRHATAYLMIGLFEVHDSVRFETTAISYGPASGDDMRGRLEKAFARFVDVQDQNDDAVAHLLRDLQIDIAIDLKGYTQHSRPGILAHRPAPLQVNFLGYPGTMGVDYVDYIVADRFVIPADHRSFYSEKIVYLPHAYQPNDSRRPIGRRRPTRAEAGLPEIGFVFCCFNQHYKLTPPIFDIWMRLLHQVPESILWMLDGDAAAIRNLRSEAARRGISPDRLIFAPRTNPEKHLARQGLADLLLDTLPYNAHTTASDALWAGLPMVTCAGSSFAARVAGSLLGAVGLPELITDNLEDYETLALKLAREPGLLKEVKVKLVRQKLSSALFDTDRFRRGIETAYETMWQRYQRGERPESFAVPSSDSRDREG